jgi:hypothetical protein
MRVKGLALHACLVAQWREKHQTRGAQLQDGKGNYINSMPAPFVKQHRCNRTASSCNVTLLLCCIAAELQACATAAAERVTALEEAAEAAAASHDQEVTALRQELEEAKVGIMWLLLLLTSSLSRHCYQATCAGAATVNSPGTQALIMA